jgi:hypothetical protein
LSKQYASTVRIRPILALITTASHASSAYGPPVTGESLNMIILLLGLIALREVPPFNMKSPD